MKIAVLALIENSGKFLCISRKEDPSKVGLIGGKSEEGEDLVVALKREIEEEIGVKDVEIGSLLYSQVLEGFTVKTFSVKLLNLNLTPEQGASLFWLSPSELTDKSKWSDYNQKVLEAYSKKSELGISAKSSE